MGRQRGETKPIDDQNGETRGHKREKVFICESKISTDALEKGEQFFVYWAKDYKGPDDLRGSRPNTGKI